MSLYCNFYLEAFDGGAWRARPPARDGRFEAFLSLNIQDPRHVPVAALFFWDGALLRFHDGAPPHSELCAWLSRLEGRLAWRPFDALFIDDWASEPVLATQWVDTPWAVLFGDGTGPFPVEGLRQAGCAHTVIEAMRCGSPTDHPISHAWGPPRRHPAPDNGPKVAVTWTDTLAGLLGEQTVDAFRAQQRPDAPQTRVVACTA